MYNLQWPIFCLSVKNRSQGILDQRLVTELKATIPIIMRFVSYKAAVY